MSRKLYIEKFDKNFVDKYFVKDIGESSKARVICVLDSPHTDEILSKYPATGAAGAIMTKHMVKQSYSAPIGWLINKGISNVENISVMSSFLIPMQYVYERNDIVAKFKEELQEINNLKAPYRDDQTHKLDMLRIIKPSLFIKELVEDFKTRLSSYISDSQEPLCILLCGAEAKLIFDYAFKAYFEYRKGNISEIEMTISGKEVEVICMPDPTPNEKEVSRWNSNARVRTKIERLKSKYKF